MRSFHELFGVSPDVVAHAPGRVNLIGEHTDYNDGFVLPVAIPLRTEVQLRRRADRRVRAWSTAFAGDRPVTFDLDVAQRSGDWADYLRAIVSVLRERGVTAGADIRIDSRVPLGSAVVAVRLSMFHSKVMSVNCGSWIVSTIAWKI